MPDGLQIASTNYNFLEWPKPLQRTAILWEQSSAGYWSGSDRGAAQDIYETTLSFYDTETNINALQTALGSNREGISLAAFSVPIFSPTVDHTVSISAAVTSFGKRRQTKFVPAASGMYVLDVAFRAISPTLLTPTPSLSTLRLQESFDADHTWEAGKAFTYDQTASYADSNSDVGTFKAKFTQTTAEMQAIIAYILVTARAGTVVLPTFAGVTYPFGIAKGSGAFNCKINDFKVTRNSVHFWDIEIMFTEAA